MLTRLWANLEFAIRTLAPRAEAALEANGYVSRQTKREDHRGVVLSLTAKAEKAEARSGA